jgi:hypothetical protein
MRIAIAAACVALGLFATTGAASASARWSEPQAPLDVAIYDRTSGELLPLHRHRGELYVAGEPGHEYEIRLRSREHGRVLAVTSVDGVNVVSGETAATSQGGYVLDGWSSTSIDGWRKNLDEVAAFYIHATAQLVCRAHRATRSCRRHRRRDVPRARRRGRTAALWITPSGTTRSSSCRGTASARCGRLIGQRGRRGVRRSRRRTRREPRRAPTSRHRSRRAARIARIGDAFRTAQHDARRGGAHLLRLA